MSARRRDRAADALGQQVAWEGGVADVPELDLPSRPSRRKRAAPAAPDAPRDWDASSYDRVADPQEEWGREVLDRLSLNGDETVLDAGCGSGRVTKLLVERLPNGRVIGVDGSPAMIEQAREALGDDVELIVSDLLELKLKEDVDAVFSSATFHWIDDHKKLFSRLHGSLKPKGSLVAQCGGCGNVATLRAAISQVVAEVPFSEHFEGWRKPWNFPTTKDTESLLERAGFVGVSCWDERRVVRPKRPREYLETVCLGSHLERLPEELRARFVDRVVDHLPDSGAWSSSSLNVEARRGPELDYVRLNIDARRGK